MHPVLAHRARLGTYLLAWIPGAGLLAGKFRLEGWGFGTALALAIPASLLASVLFLSSYYLCRAAPLRGGRPLPLLGTWAAAAALMGGLWSAAVWLLLQLMVALSLLDPAQAGAGFNRPGGWIGVAGIGAVFYIVTLAFHYLVIAQEEGLEAERHSQELHALAREAELKALRAQLNPHFLFNSLNSISALTTIDPKGARRMCVLLADFLRKSLKLGERPMVSLAEELDLVRAYLAIEQIRFGARLQVAWSVDPATDPAQIPPLLLQPLVENAIKHGIAQRPEGGILAITAAPRGGHVEIRLENATDPDAEAPVGLGMGLQQVRRRLRGRFGASAQFQAGPGGSGFQVILLFPAGEVSHD
jgi:hypothetical protein